MLALNITLFYHDDRMDMMFQILIHQNLNTNKSIVNAWTHILAGSVVVFWLSHFTLSNISITCLLQIINTARIRSSSLRHRNFIPSPLNYWNHLLSHLISKTTAPDCNPFCCEVVYKAHKPASEPNYLCFWFPTLVSYRLILWLC